MTQTQLEELPIEDLKWELENRLDEYVPSGDHIWNAVIDESSIQRVDGPFQVEATCRCACGATVELEIKLEPTQPQGLLLFKPWTLVYIRKTTRPTKVETQEVLLEPAPLAPRPRRSYLAPPESQPAPDLDALKRLLERRGPPKPPKSNHLWGALEIDKAGISSGEAYVFCVCARCGAKREYYAHIQGKKWVLDDDRYVVPKNYKETECYRQRKTSQSLLSEVRGYTETDPDLLNPPLEERAENVPASVLARMGSIDERVIFRLTDYLTNDLLTYPLFMLGPKGYGKTFAVLKALNRKIRESPSFLPIMFIYRRNNTFELLPPLALAEPEDWGERLSLFEDMDEERLKTLLERADAIVMDDLHYRCEAILDGETSLGLLIADLRLILELLETGKKIILVSELPLAYYGEIIEDEDLDDVLAYYCQAHYIRGKRRRELMAKGSPISVFEVPPIYYRTWCRLWDTYGFDAVDAVKQIIFQISDKPRFFIRMMSLFEDLETKFVDVEDLCREAAKKMKTGIPFVASPGTTIGSDSIVASMGLQYVSKASMELYEAITGSPLYARYGDATTNFIARRYELVQTVCRAIARTMGMPPSLTTGQARRWGAPFYAARTLEKMNPSEFEAVLEKALDLYMPEYPLVVELLIDKERREELKSLVQLCYRTPRMAHFMLFYYQQAYTIQVRPEQRERGWYLEHGYVEHIEMKGVYILLEPFRKAFQDLTENRRLIEVDAHNYKRDCLRVQSWASYVLSRRHGLDDCGLLEAQGIVKCPICGEVAESYTLSTPLKISIYRHPNGKSLRGHNIPENSPPSAYNQPGLRYHYIIREEEERCLTSRA